MVKVIFARHGYSEFNKTKQYAGHLDVSLELEGHEQASDFARYVLDTYKIDKIYSSTLSRAVDTAMPVAEALGLQIHKRKELMEINVGKWQGKYIADVPTLYPEDYKGYTDGTGIGRATDGESYMDARVRVMSFLDEVSKTDDGKTIVAVSHGGLIRSMLWGLQNKESLLGEIPIIPNASITVINYEKGESTIEVLGYNGYLTDKEKTVATE